MLKLQISSLKQLFRNKEAIFWSLMFPVIFLVVFRLFDFTGSVNLHVAVIDEADNEVTNSIIENLKQIDGLGINTEYTDRDLAKEDLQSSKEIDFEFINSEGERVIDDTTLNTILYFPPDYGDYEKLSEINLEDFDFQNGEAIFKAEIIFNESDEGQGSPSAILQSIISDINYNQTIGRAVQVDPLLFHPYSVGREGVSVNEIRYYDILVPGLIAMGIMQSGVIGMASNIATLKEMRILKRLSATPLPIWKFLLAEINSYLILNILQITLMLGIAHFLMGANIYGNIALIFGLATFGSFVFLSVGFIAAAITKTSNAATGVANAVSTPMMFLSGVFFPRDTLPDFVKSISDLLPLSPLIDALRKVSIQGVGIFEIRTEILLLFFWTFLAFIIAAKLFKFREE